MKWLLALLAVLCMVAPATAGEDPYIAIVGTDCVGGSRNAYGNCPGTGSLTSCLSGVDINGAKVVGQANPWYFSSKYQQFMYNENDPATFAIPLSFGTFPTQNQYTRVGSPGTEMYRSQTANNQPEVCSTYPFDYCEPCLPHCGPLSNSKTPAGNAGFYEWYIHLPKKPSGEINIVIQCGVLKPNALAFYPSWNPSAIELCAAETGEHIGAGMCVRQEVDPGVSPVKQTALPKITAMAYPGFYNVDFTPFHLTAFKNPSSYVLAMNPVPGSMSNNANAQVLDGSTDARILLKACMDKSIVTKLPVTGEINALGETETDLVGGDIIYVRMDVPRQNTVDIYCHAQSVRVAGIGESP
jgi:hypothetical protein